MTAKRYHEQGCTCARCTFRNRQRCHGSGDDPRCATTYPHAHCVCMLPMATGADMCELCKWEGLVPLDIDQMIWDGKTYPSWRNNRRRSLHAEAYLALAEAMAKPI